jgi:high-affinity nickel-transport protein
MEPSASDWPTYLALAALLGMKHGLDADHLATVDGLTRFNSRAAPGLARWCGTLFSAGHGAVVILVALAVGGASAKWDVPGWIEDLGAWISIGFLTLLGVLNLAAVLTARQAEVVQPVGLRGKAFGRFQRTSNPFVIAGIGGLFALSFDTMSQAALFAIAGAQQGGWRHAALLALVFTMGMMVADGLNGLWISRLIRRADRTALFASRVMGLVVAMLSLLVAGFGILKYLSPGIDAWSDGKELLLGAAVVAVVAVSFLVALRLSRPARYPASA